MSNTAVVMTKCLELEAQMDGFGWDQGLGFWGLHAHAEDYSDLVANKFGGSEFMDMHPLDLIRSLPRPPVNRPSCVIGVALSFECWQGMPPAWEDPNRVSVRYLICALATGVVIVVEHVRDAKPKCYLLDSLRALAFNSEAGAVAMALRDHVVAQDDDDDHLPPGLPPELRALLRMVEQTGGGFIILGGE